MLNSLLILLFSHLFVDFILQSDSFIEKKNSTCEKKKWKALLWHMFSFYIVSLLLFFLVKDFSLNIIWELLLLAISHCLIDYIKTILNNKFSEALLFISDQVLHLFLILIFVILYNDINLFSINALAAVLDTESLAFFQKTLILLCVIILITEFGNVIIRVLLSSLKINIIKAEDDKKIKMGRYIGGVERILTAMAVISGKYEVLLALYGSKTAIRYSESSRDPEFGEYYLLGTLLSVLIGIIGGVILKSVFVI